MPKRRWITGAALARELNVTRQRIDALRKKGTITRRANDKKYDLEKCKKIIEESRQLNRDISEHKKENESGVYSSILEAKKIHESYKARLAELEYRKKNGELVEVAEIVAAIQYIITAAKTKLLAIPVKLAPELVGQDSIKVVKNIIEDEIHQVLSELAKMTDVT